LLGLDEAHLGDGCDVFQLVDWSLGANAVVFRDHVYDLGAVRDQALDERPADLGRDVHHGLALIVHLRADFQRGSRRHRLLAPTLLHCEQELGIHLSLFRSSRPLLLDQRLNLSQGALTQPFGVEISLPQLSGVRRRDYTRDEPLRGDDRRQ
jgi:hypothetical protein